MHYVCLVYHDPDIFDAAYSDGLEELDRDSLAYDKELDRRGHLILAHALHPETRAKVVRRRGQKKLVTDGPFSESKEQLIGFLVIEAEDMAEAVEIGSNIPLARTGTVLVREAIEAAA